jgi:hypothetical protein
MTYQDVLSTPTYERKFYLDTLVKENEKRRENVKDKTYSTGKGSRTKTITGDSLKNKLRSGEIPNNS